MNARQQRQIAAAAAIALFAGLALAQQHLPGNHDHAAPARPAAAAPGDPRVAVDFPQMMREHTLANMRDHLLALQEIQAALGAGKYDHAAAVAEGRLGMTSLQSHGAHDVAKFMPQGMQAAGTAMHRSASRFALAAQSAAVSDEVKPALTALAEVTAQCVACHAGYRFR